MGKLVVGAILLFGFGLTGVGVAGYLKQLPDYQAFMMAGFVTIIGTGIVIGIGHLIAREEEQELLKLKMGAKEVMEEDEENE